MSRPAFRHLLPALLLILCLGGCGDIYRQIKSGDVSWALKQELRDKQSKEIDLANLTRFEWDELQLFSPYADYEHVCPRLGIALEPCRSAISLSYSDGTMPMAFLLKGQVVHTEMHFLWHGDFTPVPLRSIKAESAVFAVIPDGQSTSGGRWLRLRLRKP